MFYPLKITTIISLDSTAIMHPNGRVFCRFWWSEYLNRENPVPNFDYSTLHMFTQLYKRVPDCDEYVNESSRSNCNEAECFPEKSRKRWNGMKSG